MSVEFGLDEIGALDGEEGLAFGHPVAEIGEEPDDLALVGGEDLDRHVLVEVDAADRLLLDRKGALARRLDLDPFELGVGEAHALIVGIDRGLELRLRRRGLGGVGASGAPRGIGAEDEHRRRDRGGHVARTPLPTRRNKVAPHR